MDANAYGWLVIAAVWGCLILMEFCKHPRRYGENRQETSTLLLVLYAVLFLVSCVLLFIEPGIGFMIFIPIMAAYGLISAFRDQREAPLTT